MMRLKSNQTPEQSDDKRPMRIAVILEGLRPDGGAEALLRTFADHLGGTPHQLRLFFLKPLTPDVERYLDSLGLPHTVYYARRMVDIPRMLRLSRDLKDVDVVQTNLVGPNVIGTAAARIAGRGSVAVLHNERTYADDHLYHGKAEQFALRRLATRVVAVGPRTQQARQEFLPGVKIHILPNAVGPGPELLPGEREQLRAEVMTNPEGRLILNVGRLNPQKAQANLIEAVPRILQDVPDAELVIAGQGDLKDDLQALIDRLDLHHQVHLTGTRDDIRKVMAAADVFALPSSWEGLPIALLEAMAAEVPVLATGVGDVTSVIDEDAGWLIKDNSPATIAEGIVSAMLDPDGEERVKRAKNLVDEKFNAEVWADTMLGHLRAAHAFTKNSGDAEDTRHGGDTEAR